MCGLRCSLVQSVWADRHRTQKRRILISQNPPTPSRTNVIAIGMEMFCFWCCSWCVSSWVLIGAFLFQFWSLRFWSFDYGKLFCVEQFTSSGDVDCPALAFDGHTRFKYHCADQHVTECNYFMGSHRSLMAETIATFWTR